MENKLILVRSRCPICMRVIKSHTKVFFRNKSLGIEIRFDCKRCKLEYIENLRRGLTSGKNN